MSASYLCQSILGKWLKTLKKNQTKKNWNYKSKIEVSCVFPIYFYFHTIRNKPLRVKSKVRVKTIFIEIFIEISKSGGTIKIIQMMKIRLICVPISNIDTIIFFPDDTTNFFVLHATYKKKKSMELKF